MLRYGMVVKVNVRERSDSGEERSVEVESYFDGLAHWRGPAIRSSRRPEPPGAHCFDRFFVQAQPEALQHLNVSCFAFRGDDRDQRHRALVFRFYSLVGILRLRTINTCWIAVAARAGVEHAAAGAATFSWTNASAAAASNAGAIAGADTIAATGAVRIINYFRERVAPVVHVGTRQLQVRRTQNRRGHRQARVRIRDYLWRSELRHREFRQLAAARGQRVVRSATTAATSFLRAGRQLR